MIKPSASSRTQRSKGFVRAKQILLLLGICFWLVYQLKYSHDKKKAILDEKDSEISNKEQDGRKSGRKELLPRVYDNKQHSAAEEDEDKVEDEDEGSKVEEDEHEEVEESNVRQLEDDVKKEVDSEEDDREEEEILKNDEPENHEKPGEVEEEEEGLKELENREQERPREEGEDHEEFIDEEKSKEEEPENEGNGEEVKNKQVEDDDEDQDRDEISREAHEAREEHYKGDDASSAVTHDDTEIDAVETIEGSSGSESSNGSEDHDNATELANSSPTDETELVNAAAVNSTAIVEASTDQPELIESSSNHPEDTEFGVCREAHSKLLRLGRKQQRDQAFMESHLPGFKSSNPQFEVVTELVRGQHPLLKGFYKNKNEREGGLCKEEYGQRRGTDARHEVEELVKKESSEAED